MSPTPPPPPAPGGARTRPPLRRAREGRILTGLAAGLARHLGIDVSVTRILLVLLGLLTNGVALIAYLIGSLFVPADDPQAPAGAAPAPAERRDPAFWLGVVLLVIASVWLLGGIASPWSVFGVLMRHDVLLALILVGFGVALWRSSDRATTTDPPAGPPPTPAAVTVPAATRTLDPAYPEATAMHPTTEPSTAPAWTPPPVPVRERSLLGRITLGVAFLAVGVLWLLRTVGVLPIDVTGLVAAALVVVGVGLLVGAFVGRARWLIVVGVLLVPLLMVGVLLRPVLGVDFPRDGGDVVVTPPTAAELESAYRLGGGRLVVDLEAIELDGGSHSLQAELGAGELIVVLPDDVTATVHAEVGIGELRIDDVALGGFGLSRTQVIEVGDGAAELDLRLRVGAGQLTVRTP
jgi:phage shock protein PspC (stress-responsive transcriptional regulator)